MLSENVHGAEPEGFAPASAKGRSHRATLIFDYDGTLHDCIRIYAPSFRRVYAWLVSNGYVEPRNFSDGEISRWLGWTPKDMWDSFAPFLPQDVRESCSRAIGENMLMEIRSGHARLYPGVPQTMDILLEAGYTMVFLSNCRTNYKEAQREAFGLDRWFSAFFCTQDFDYIPKQEVFPYIAERFEGPYVAIGDRFHDMELAYAHGLRSIGCLYGFGEPGELDRATVRVDDISEIPGVLAGWDGL